MLFFVWIIDVVVGVNGIMLVVLKANAKANVNAFHWSYFLPKKQSLWKLFTACLVGYPD